MSAAEPQRPVQHKRGVVSRADLLEALHASPLTWFALPSVEAQPGGNNFTGGPGYELQLQEEPPPVLPPVPDKGRSEWLPPPAAARRPLKMPHVWVVADASTRSAEPERQAPDPQAQVLPLPPPPQRTPQVAAAAAARAWNEGAAAGWTRLRTQLRAHFDTGHTGGAPPPVDWRAAVARLARGQALAPLPRRRLQRWPANLVLALDRRASSLTPLVFDMDNLASQLRRAVGSRAVQVRVLAEDPGQAYQPLLPPGGLGLQARQGRAGLSKPAPWQPLFGGWLLVVSDLGWAARDPMRAAQFQAWAKALLHGGTRIATLAPLPQRLPVPGAATVQQVLPWGRSALAPVVTPGALVQHPLVLDLLALLALVGGASDVLLRALAALLSPSGVDRGLIWAAWNHPHVRVDGHHCSLVDEQAPAHAQRLRQLPAALVRAAHSCRQRLQAALPWAEEHLAALRACTLAPQAAEELADSYARAWQYLQRQLPEQLQHSAAAKRGILLCQTQLVVALAHPAVRAAHRDVFERLQSLGYADALQRGESVPSFEGLGPASPPGEPWADADADQTAWQLVQRGSMLSLLAQDSPKLNLLLLPLGPAPSHRGITVQVQQSSQWLPVAKSDEVPLVDLDTTDGPVSVQFGPHQVTLRSVLRPSWALGWQQTSAKGLEVLFNSPWGGVARLGNPYDPLMPVRWVRANNGTAHHFSADTSGLYLDLEINRVIQRFRYIEPGTFLMGSPAIEADRSDAEGPQHPVTISQGYWLADTPCTQALWMAVMDGQNPSRFQVGAEAGRRPVDSVSWDDAQQFLQRLLALLPAGSQPVLPTEAEWEYAARAGSDTAYAWGDEFDVQRANTEESSIGETKHVKSYASNAWGLYDMHGNVWEWCADAPRSYQDQAELDPSGGTEGDLRVLRGGSWFNPAAFARSACRARDRRGGSWRDFCFRLALRSPSPEPGGPGSERPGGPAVFAGRRPAREKKPPARKPTAKKQS